MFNKESLYFSSFREKELAAVKINAADVDIIANELEVRFTSVSHICLVSHLQCL